MRTLITNGTIVGADGSTAADVLIDGETIALIGRNLAATRDRRRDPRRDRQVRDPGRHRRPYPHGAAVRWHVRQGHLRERDAGRGLRRDDLDRRLRGPVAWRLAPPGSRRVARQGRGQRCRRLRLPHDHERRQRRDPGRDGRPGRRGRPRLQAVHGLPGRLLQRRRRDLPGDAADREERRADHDARRERHGHRRRRRADRRRRHDRPDRPRPGPQGGLRGRGDQPGDPPGRGGRRSPSTSSTSRPGRPWPRSGRPATAAPRPSPRPARSTCSCRSTTSGTASTARSSCARRRSARRTSGRTSGRGS